MKKSVMTIFTVLAIYIALLNNPKPQVAAANTLLPDLVVQSIEFTPANPNPNDPVDIKVTVKNIGTSAVSGIRLHLFVNPVDQPPTETTPYTAQTLYGLSLPAGGVFTYTRTGHTFSADGIYPIYAWVDRQNSLAEEDDFNNLSSTSITVGTQIPTYEPDDSCAQAKEIATDGSQQARELETAEDVDYIKFMVVAGNRYKAVVTPNDANAEITADFLESCLARGGASGEFVAAVTGTYYVRVSLVQDLYGVSRGYRIHVNDYGATPVTPDPTITPTVTPPVTITPPPPSCAQAAATLRVAPRLQFVAFMPILISPRANVANARDVLSDPELEPNILGFGYEKLSSDITPLDGVETCFTIQLKTGVVSLPPLIEIFAENIPTLMRDDGAAPDVNAGDGIYTALVTLSQEEFDLVQLAPNPADRPQDNIETPQELFITDLSVVADPTRTNDICGPTGAVGNADGAWSFKTLMMNLAQTSDEGVAADFAQNWLDTWLTDQTVLNPLNETDIIEARPAMGTLILNSWQKQNGKLDLDLAPLRLQALVFRPDLRNHPAVHLASPNQNDVSAGEMRFVFAFIPNCSVEPFTVIFEYGMRASNMREVKNIAKQIHALGDLTLGTEAYNSALQTLTDNVVLNNTINQVRTNEIALSNPWELREFDLNRSTLQLVPTTVKQTPDNSRNGTGEISAFINANTSQLTFVDPFTQEANPRHNVLFAGGNSLTPFFPPVIWDGSGIINSAEARFQFSLNTCNGCHLSETDTLFTHVDPRNFGTPSFLSGFLTGGTANNGVSGPRSFNDLARRERDLNFILNSTPFELVIFDGLNSREH